MNVHIGYKVHKTPDIEKEIHAQVEKLRRRLQVFRPELVHLKGTVEQNPERDGTMVSLNLRLPSGQMASQQSASNATSAVKAAFDDVLQQITKHKDLLRSTHKWRRRGSANGAEVGVPFEQTLAAVHPPKISGEDVRSYVSVNLGRFQRFVEREFYFRQAADETLPDSISSDEIVDEAIARALTEGERPEKLSLEPWLYRLAMQAMDEMVAESHEVDLPVHLEDSARSQNVRASDEPELQFHQPDETLTRESVIADRRLATPEQAAVSHEMLALVHSALRGVKRLDREAFLLYGIEGFSIPEISVITDRRPEEVEASIAASRAHMKKAPSLVNQFRPEPLAKTTIV
jgi:DNA-directed RNA polymerase specialized sigma24 family protein/ribosome-associated translation inhibitor RaiA